MDDSYYYLYLHVREAELLSRLVLNASDAARVCGVTTRQLTYWTDKGIVPYEEGNTRSYGIKGLTKAVLVRQAMDAGYTLEKAAELVDGQLSQAKEAAAAHAARTDEDLAMGLDERLLRLSKGLSAFRVQLPTYLTLCRLMRLVAKMDGGGAQQVLHDSPYTVGENEAVANQMERALDELEAALRGMRSGLAIA